MASYLIILVVALLAAFNAPWYSFLGGAAVLVAISLRSQRKYQARFATLGLSGHLETAAYASTAHALLATLAAYALGMFARNVFLVG
jgi:hypothetical protein